MANIKSAEKRNRQRIKRRARNVKHTTHMRTIVKKVAAAIETKGKGAAEALKAAIPALDKAAKHGVLKKKTASRKISRLTKAVNKLAAAAAK